MQLALLICLGFLLRIVPIWGNNFPFAYDNAKDSLSMMNMWLTKSPTLLGPVTSLEGLYNGPLWYYIALPFNIIVHFHPLASVITVMLLAALATIVLYKYWGKLAALLFTISAGVIATQQTAWTPYITMFPAILTLIPLSHVLKRKPLTTLDFALFFISVGLMLHTEIAFAVVFALCLAVIVLRQKLFPSLKQLFIGLFLFALLLLPHAAFEIKHDFLQTRSVIRLVTHFQEESAKVSDGSNPLQKFASVSTSIGMSFSQSLVPGIFLLPGWISTILMIGFLIWLIKAEATKSYVKVILLPILATALILYLFLPSKPFYFVSLMPFWIIGGALLLKAMKRRGRQIIVSLLILAALIYVITSFQTYQSLARTSSILFSSRLKAVDTAYTLAKDQPFASYEYVPEVYDFTYQQIYQYTAVTKNRPLPTAISYFPSETAYNPWYARTDHESKINILIVEKDDRPQFFPVWWEKMMKDREILSQTQVTDTITVYLTKNKKK